MEDLKEQIVAMRQSFFDEEILDNYFTQLEQLEDEDNPNFVEDVITMFVSDSTKHLAIIEDEMKKTPVDYIKLDKYLHQLKGSSSSIGANKVRIEVNKTREYCRERNMEGAMASFQDLRRELDSLKAKLEFYYQLLAQVGPLRHQAGDIDIRLIDGLVLCVRCCLLLRFPVHCMLEFMFLLC